MTQAVKAHGCRHGFKPGNCTAWSCSNASPTAKRLASPLRAQAERFGRLVARDYFCGLDALFSADRHKVLAEARMVLYYVCRHWSEPCWSYPQIGNAIGRDHTTVMHGVRAIGQRMVEDSRLQARVQSLLEAARKSTGASARPFLSLVGMPEIPDLEVGA